MILDNKQKLGTRSVRSTHPGPAFSVGISGLGLLVLWYQSVSSHPQSFCSTLTLEMLVVYNLDFMVGMVATAGIVLDVYFVGQKYVPGFIV